MQASGHATSAAPRWLARHISQSDHYIRGLRGPKLLSLPGIVGGLTTIQADTGYLSIENRPEGRDYMYKCLSCGKEVEIDLSVSKKIICPFCGYRILKKTRPVVVKSVQAR